MLNKNQSKRKNSWKYALVIPALVAFMFYFQVDVIAQEKPSAIRTQAVESQSDDVEVVIDKNSSDAHLKSSTDKLKNEHGITLKFSKVKRNTNGEIVAIKAEFNDKAGNKGVSQISSDEPIKPITFFKTKNSIGFGKSKTVVITKNVKSSKGSEDDDTSIIINSEDDDESTDEHRVVVKKSDDGKHTIVMMNGEVLVDTEKIMADIKPVVVDGVTVIGHPNSDQDGVVINTAKITRMAMQQAEEAMKQARIEMELAGPEMERAKAAIAKARPEMEKAKLAQENAKVQMEQAKKEIEQAREEIRKAKLEIEQARAEMQKEREAIKKK